MRILILYDRIPWPLHDGGAIAMYNLLKGLHEKDYEISVLSFNTRKHQIDPDQLPIVFQKLKRFETVQINTNVNFLGAFLNLLSTQSYQLSRFKSVRFENILSEILSGSEFDIIHLEGIKVSIYLPLIRKLTTAKVIMRSHNVEYLIWERMAQSETNLLKKWYLSLTASRLKKYEISILNRLDAIVSITGYDTRIFRTHSCKIPIHISPTGLNIADYKIMPDILEWPSVFHLGALNWLPNQQGLKWFIEDVWPTVRQDYPDVNFYIAGRDIPNSIYAYHNKNGVKVVGEIDNAVDFINSKAIMVVPLLSGSGMRIKIIEGMALGKAIVSTGVGAEGLSCINGKDIIIADSENEFSEALIKCLRNYNFTKELGENARDLIEEDYDNKKIIARLSEFYSQLVMPSTSRMSL